MEVEILGVRLFAEVQGEGPPLVFIHGLGVTSSVWYAAKSVLSRNFRVVTFDLSGSGRSDLSKRIYSIDTWAEEAAGLLDALELPSAVIIGHSMGSLIAQRFASRFPERTRALVLAGALTELPLPAKEIYTNRVALVEKEGMIAIADQLVAGALTPATREANLPLTGLLRDIYLSNSPTCHAGHCRALVDASASLDQPKISCPTLMLVGDQDSITPLAVQRTVSSAIVNSRIRIVPRTAHMTMLEVPDAFNSHMLEFLAALNH